MHPPDPFLQLESDWRESARDGNRALTAARRHRFARRWPDTCHAVVRRVPGGTVAVEPIHLQSAGRLLDELFPTTSSERPAAQAFLEVLETFERSIPPESASPELADIADRLGLPVGFVNDVAAYLRRGSLEKWPHATQFRVLFLDTGAGGIAPGVVGTVTMEVRATVAPNAAAQIYPTPAQSCTYHDEAWGKMETHVSGWLGALGAAGRGVEFRWALALPGHGVAGKITGGSAGLIFALGAAQCLVRSGNLPPAHPLAVSLDRVSLAQVASLAALDGSDGALGEVGGDWSKLRAAAEFFPRVTHVLAAESMRDPLESAYPGLRESPPLIEAALRVHFADRVEAAAEALRQHAHDGHGAIPDYDESSRRRHRRYHSRKLIEDDLQATLHDARRAESGLYWLIVADGFFGKSAFCTHLFPADSPGVVGHFFKEWPETRGAVHSLVEQLRRWHPEIPEPAPNSDLQVMLGTALRIAGEQARRRGSVQLVVLDGLDEARTVAGESAFAKLLPRRLPPGVVVVVTARHFGCLDGIAKPDSDQAEGVRRLNLTPEARATHPDEIAEFLRRRNEALGLGLEPAFVARMAAACEDLFGLACWFLDDERPEFRDDIVRWRGDPESLPRGPIKWAVEQWDRLLDRARERRLSDATVRGVMTLLALARTPLSTHELLGLLDGARAAHEAGILGRRPVQAFAPEGLEPDHIEHILEAALPFFDPTGRRLPPAETPLRFFHSMLPELILGIGSPLTEHPRHPLPATNEKKWCRAVLAAGCAEAWANGESAARLHALRHLPAYLRAAGKWDELLALLTAPDAGFPMAKLCEEDADGIPWLARDLVQDYLYSVLHWPGHGELAWRQRLEEYYRDYRAYWAVGGPHAEDPERAALPVFPQPPPPLDDPRFQLLTAWTQTFSEVAPELMRSGFNPLGPLLNQASDGPVTVWARRHLNL